jgi:hypothetical protein
MPQRANQVQPRIRGVSGALSLQLPRYKFKIAGLDGNMMAPPTGLLPLLRWARGPLSVSCRSGTPLTCFKSSQGAWCTTTRCHVSSNFGPCLPVEEGSGATMYLEAPDPASSLRRALVLLHVPWLWTPPPHWGGLHRCHASHGSLWVIEVKNKEMCRWPSPIASIVRSHDAHSWQCSNSH